MIKAIDTRYKGYLFRSRLEARWAVFFDQMGWSWDYEPEGFELGGTQYLPDFKVAIPRGDHTWFEVKPRETEIDPKFDAFFKLLTKETIWGNAAQLLRGDPVDHLERIARSNQLMCLGCGTVIKGGYSACGGGEVCCYCDFCDFTGHTGDKYQGLCAPYTYHKGSLCFCTLDIDAAHRRLRAAAVAARSARFEFGGVSA
jgi:hypothetical protein